MSSLTIHQRIACIRRCRRRAWDRRDIARGAAAARSARRRNSGPSASRHCSTCRHWTAHPQTSAFESGRAPAILERDPQGVCRTGTTVQSHEGAGRQVEPPPPAPKTAPCRRGASTGVLLDLSILETREATTHRTLRPCLGLRVNHRPGEIFDIKRSCVITRV